MGRQAPSPLARASGSRRRVRPAAKGRVPRHRPLPQNPPCPVLGRQTSPQCPPTARRPFRAANPLKFNSNCASSVRKYFGVSPARARGSAPIPPRTPSRRRHHSTGSTRHPAPRPNSSGPRLRKTPPPPPDQGKHAWLHQWVPARTTDRARIARRTKHCKALRHLRGLLRQKRWLRAPRKPRHQSRPTDRPHQGPHSPKSFRPSNRRRSGEEV